MNAAVSIRRLASTMVLLGACALGHAGLIDVQGGSSHVSPSSNDILGAGVSGSIGSNVFLNAPARLTFTYLGKEAAWQNLFSASGDVGSGVFDTGSSVVGDTFSVRHNTAGLLSFRFDAQRGSYGSVHNGSNPMPPSVPNFFVHALSASSLLLALDDGGAGPDVDHDDLVVRVDAVGVPEPATWAVLGGCLFVVMLRRRVAAAK